MRNGHHIVGSRAPLNGAIPIRYSNLREIITTFIHQRLYLPLKHFTLLSDLKLGHLPGI